MDGQIFGHAYIILPGGGVVFTSICSQKQRLVSGALEHSVLCVQEIYAWDNVVLYIAVYGPYKP